MSLISRLNGLKDNIIDIVLVENNITEIYVILEKENKKTINEIKQISKEEKTIIKTILVNELLYNKDIKKILYNGLSLKKNKKISEITDTRPLVLVTYSLENLSHSKKTLFGYVLKGRENEKGLLGELKGSVIGRNNVLVPYENLKNLEEFMKYWKISYKKIRCLFVDQNEKEGNI